MTIKKKFVISFLALALISVNLTAALGYYSSRDSLEKLQKEKLLAIADAREQNLLSFLEVNKSIISSFSNDGSIAEELKTLGEQADALSKRHSVDHLNNALDIKVKIREDYYELFIIDRDGIVVASTDRSKIGDDEAYDDYFIEGKNGFYVKDVHYYARTGKNSLDIAHPIIYQDPNHQLSSMPEFVGVMTARIETSHLDDIVSGAANKNALTFSQGIDATEESYLVNKDRLMITPSIFRQGAFLKQKVDTLPVQECLSKQKEIVGVYPNYIDENVIGVSMCIPSMNWVLLTEISTKDAFAPTVALKNRSIILALMMAILSALLATWSIKKISKPIKLLVSATQNMVKGNMNQKIKLEGNDEIGILAKEFNKMTESLNQRTRDLTRSEKKFRELFESSQDAIMTLGPPEWRFASCNPATIKMFGAKDEKEFTSFEPWKLSPEKQPNGKSSKEMAKEMINKAMQDGSNFFEWTHRRINGEDFRATVLLSRIKETGKSLLQATVRDVTEQKNIEESLMRFNKLAIDRELKMIELKQKIKSLEGKKDG